MLDLPSGLVLGLRRNILLQLCSRSIRSKHGRECMRTLPSWDLPARNGELFFFGMCTLRRGHVRQRQRLNGLRVVSCRKVTREFWGLLLRVLSWRYVLFVDPGDDVSRLHTMPRWRLLGDNWCVRIVDVRQLCRRDIEFG
jgi:hypothetical protein